MMTYLVYHPEYRGDDPWEVEASDHESAAEDYAEHYDSDGDYTIAGQKDVLVLRVVNQENGKEKQIKVVGEVIPNYIAREVKK